MKVGAKTLSAIMGVVTAQGLNEHKTITMTPGTNLVTLTTTSGTGSANARIIAITEEDEAISACAVPSQILQALAANSSEGVIEISKPNRANTLAARAGASATSLATREPTDFFPFDIANPPSERTTFSLPLAVLAGSIHRVQFAAANPNKTTNIALTMTEFNITEAGILRTAATNGVILSYAETPIPDWTGEPITLLVPQTKALARLLDLAPDAKAHIMVADNKILIVVHTEGTAVELVLNTADASFPDWQPIRDNNKPTLVATANLKAMRDLMARANAICPAASVNLRLTGTDKRLTLRTKNETTQHIDSVELDVIMAPSADGKPTPFDGEFTINGAPQQIADALAASAEWTGATHVRLGFSLPTKAFVISPIGYDYSHWLMPMVGGPATSKTAETKAA